MAVMTEATAVVVVHVVVHVVVRAVVHKQHWLSGSVWERDMQMKCEFYFTHCPFPGHGTWLVFTVNNHLSVKVQPVFSLIIF